MSRYSTHSREIPERRNNQRGIVRSLTLEMEENGYTKSEVLKRDVQVQHSQVEIPERRNN
jgi:hypothetical protein